MYKQEVFELVVDKIRSRDLKVDQAVPVLRGLALTKDPSERMCLEISVRDYLKGALSWIVSKKLESKGDLFTDGK